MRPNREGNNGRGASGFSMRSVEASHHRSAFKTLCRWSMVARSCPTDCHRLVFRGSYDSDRHVINKRRIAFSLKQSRSSSS